MGAGAKYHSMSLMLCGTTFKRGLSICYWCHAILPLTNPPSPNCHAKMDGVLTSSSPNQILSYPTCMTSFMNGSLSKVNLIVIRADTEALYLWSDVLQALHFLLTCQNKLFLFSFWTGERKQSQKVFSCI